MQKGLKGGKLWGLKIANKKQLTDNISNTCHAVADKLHVKENGQSLLVDNQKWKNKDTRCFIEGFLERWTPSQLVFYWGSVSISVFGSLWWFSFLLSLLVDFPVAFLLFSFSLFFCLFWRIFYYFLIVSCIFSSFLMKFIFLSEKEKGEHNHWDH